MASDLEIIEVENKKGAHPDSQLANEIRLNNIQGVSIYIGLSQLCCILCSLFVDLIGFEFRGLAHKFEKNWELPTNADLATRESFTKRIEEFVEIMKQQQNKVPFSVEFENRTKDNCQQASETVSDDLCLYLNYYKNNGFTEFNFILKVAKEILL